MVAVLEAAGGQRKSHPGAAGATVAAHTFGSAAERAKVKRRTARKHALEKNGAAPVERRNSYDAHSEHLPGERKSFVSAQCVLVPVMIAK